MLEVLHGRRRAYSDFGVYADPGNGHVSTAPSLENNMDKLGVEGASSRGGSFVSRTPSPSPSSRSRSRDRKNSAKHATGHLAAHAFNLMVTVPQHITKDALEDDGAPSMGKLTPDLLGGHHYEADVSDQSDSFLGLPPGHALKNLSRSTPAMSPSASPRHSDSEGPPRVSKGTKKFMRHFADAPPSERVLNYFACALVSDILLQGTLYITPNFFAFYSKIFGHVSRLLIPVSQVASVQKERTAKIIPNAVGLHMVDGKSYVFGSLLSRDSTYKLMNHILKKAQQIGDSDSEPPSAVQVAVDDDGEDSVSASAESLMEEDQADGFLATSQVVDLVGVTATTTTPWIRDGCTATTTSSITSSSNTTATASTISTAGIPGHNLPGSPNCTTVLRRGSLSSPKAGTEEPGGAGGGAGGGVGVLFEWFTQGSLVKTCFKVGSIPVKLIGEGVKELWSLPRTSILLIISTLLLLLLFASAAFMLHRVDVLSQQLGLEKYDEYNGMYEEVLQMQQRLHAAASSEIEKTLSIQLKHIATVRQSLEALVVLFNKEPPVSTAQIPDNT
ncbi:GRAM domain-containing protein 2B isoform X7 [Penaeus vannamei]|uniref:GRAM domain-containing protein 2B isoform X7 n=1 Tax=Penaeus vannamei TaxID=6689 RepID=UPI00387F907E